jgi:hypothetical protein
MRLVFSILILISAPAFSQRWAFEYWHDGKLILDSSDTLRGKIKYDINNDIIQLDQLGKLNSFTARKVVMFEIFDVTCSRYRKFYSIPYSFTGDYKTPIFFELLAEGKLTLLAREALEMKSTSSPYYGYATVSRPVLVNKYFALNDKGQLEPFTGRKDDLLDLMSQRDDEVRKFIKVNHLSLEDKYQLASIFDYYNSLFKKGS